MANISRRNFMKVAAGAAGIAGLGLLNGCSKTEAPASSAAASAAGSAAEGTTTPAAAAPATDKLYTHHNRYIYPDLYGLLFSSFLFILSVIWESFMFCIYECIIV